MKPWLDDGDIRLYHGDVRDVLRELPERSVQTVVTSPPYWGLRDYGTATWQGGEPDCDHTRPVAVSASTLGAASGGNPMSQEARERSIERSFAPYKDVCGKCGAKRIDQQLGLEATPDEYVAHLVEIFREVRRVLRDNGTVWLNIGDSYAGGGPSGASYQSETTKRRAEGDGTDGAFRVSKRLGERGLTYRDKKPHDIPDGLKAKDLCMIPARVALALQQPWYAGAIKNEHDRIWLAAMIDAEGCMFIHKRKAGQANGQGRSRKNDSYGAGLEVASTDRAIVDRCMKIAGIGSICEQTPQQNDRRKQTIYRWNARTNACRDVVKEVYPYLVAKQHEARLLLGCPSSGEKAEAAHASLKSLHQGGEPTIDFDAPDSLYEPGWYVRSDIAWCKANPMPESVRDRPTQSYEHVFLLSKRPAYFYDQDAVREDYATTTAPGTTIKQTQHYGADNGGNTGLSAHLADVKARLADERRPQVETLDGIAPEAPRGPDGRRKTVHDHSTDAGHDNYDGIVGRDRWANTGRNMRNVWTIPTESFADAHFATFPRELARRCIAAGTSEAGECSRCGAPWQRQVERDRPARGYAAPSRAGDGEWRGTQRSTSPGETTGNKGFPPKYEVVSRTTGWAPSCDCDAPVRPQTVLDCFVGSGTTALVARVMGRNAVGIDLSDEYLRIAANRTRQLSLLT